MTVYTNPCVVEAVTDTTMIVAAGSISLRSTFVTSRSFLNNYIQVRVITYIKKADKNISGRVVSTLNSILKGSLVPRLSRRGEIREPGIDS